jgi:uncharacterized membrane protein YccC
VTQGSPEEPPGSEADFTDEADLLPPAGPSVGDPVAEGRERMRGVLAGVLVGLLVLLDAAILVLGVLKVRPFDRDLLALLLAGVLNPVVALVGTVLGFYFGEKAGKSAA